MSASISSTERGSPAESTSQPSSVMTTVSSMRMPISSSTGMLMSQAKTKPGRSGSSGPSTLRMTSWVAIPIGWL
jgi:hypothetical protein